ncbi:wall-associated receptor kinase-like 8 isoform X2 [Salvia miltiorrhiza]|nr:wall-associated receptor kinase-like 8 isoform X2 [Salvia miltiorrhiza]
MRLMLQIVLLLLLMLYTRMGGGESLSKPGCPDTCGNNVTIPYPFGIGAECSANEYFRVACDNTTNPPKPFLEYMSLEALEFSLDRKVVRLLQGVFPINCSTNTVILVGKTVSRSTPFRYSSLYNRLVVIGCGNEVRMLDYDTTNGRIPSFGGCNPICGSTSPSCNGINCCQTTLPSLFEEAEVFYNSTGNGRAGSVCGYTFFSDQRWLERDYFRYLNRSGGNWTSFLLEMSSGMTVPLILEWELDVSNATTSLQGVKCMNESVYFAASLDDDASNFINTTRCNCDNGFQGNPYLPGGGCRDVDECSNSSLNNCAFGHCVNTFGSFVCKDGGGRTNSALIGISSATGGLILLGGAWIFSKVIRRRIKANRKKRFFKQNGGILLEQKLSSNDGGGENITLFASKELALATDHYNENRVLGRGGQGTVYKGMLPDGRLVAVKKSKKMEQVDMEAFINEVVILSQIRHRNVVRLLGCCLETEVPLLVYEFVPNGTLFEHIHEHNDEFPLSWKMRVRIAAEAAAALSYLHYAASAPIYHRDVKSTNILLDEKYRAKVSDFGTSRSVDLDQTHVTTRVMGTFGYLDPEYFQSNQFTEKSDVYSFGVVVVELLTGERAVRADVGRSLAAHFLQCMEENRVSEILDPKVVKEGRRKEVAAVAELARRCLHLNGKSRPTMKEVSAELEGIRMMEDGHILELQQQQEDVGFHSIEIAEEYKFSDTTTFNSITTAESSDSPLLSSLEAHQN